MLKNMVLDKGITKYLTPCSLLLVCEKEGW